MKKDNIEIRELEANFYGRVQGVRFRAVLKKIADSLNLKGFVLNKDAGNVFCVVQGDTEKIKSFLRKVEDNPGYSEVVESRYLWKEVGKKYSDFSVIVKGNILLDKFESLINLGKTLMGRGIERVPNHVAIIPDGNRRWASEKGLNKSEGHYKSGSYENLSFLIKEAKDLGIKYFSLWGFSTENWNRPKEEVDALIDVFYKGIQKLSDHSDKDKIRFRFIGRRERFPDKLVKLMNKLESKTKKYSSFNVQLCLDYGGRDEIIRGVNKILKSKLKEIDEKKFSEFLDTNKIPDPDLIIRTGDEKRLSGFMPFQGVYSELYFTDIYFPDFGAEEFRKAVMEYSRRKRRFGK